MPSLARKRRKWKRKVSERRIALEEVMKLRQIDDIDVRVPLIQALIPVGLSEVNKQLQRDVLMLAGEKYSRSKENVRWTRQDGFVYLKNIFLRFVLFQVNRTYFVVRSSGRAGLFHLICLNFHRFNFVSLFAKNGPSPVKRLKLFSYAKKAPVFN